MFKNYHKQALDSHFQCHSNYMEVLAIWFVNKKKIIANFGIQNRSSDKQILYVLCTKKDVKANLLKVHSCCCCG